MNPYCPQFGDFDEDLMIYFAGGEAMEQAPAAETMPDEAEEFWGNMEIGPADSVEEIMKTVADKYHPEKFSSNLDQQLQNVPKEGITQLDIESAKSRYQARFDYLYRELEQDTRYLWRIRRSIERDIASATQESLLELKERLIEAKQAKQTQEALNETMPPKPEGRALQILEQIPIVGIAFERNLRFEIRLKSYTDALVDYYVPVNKVRESKIGQKFARHLYEVAEARALSLANEDEKISEEQLKNFHESIDAELKRVAALDKQDDVISELDLAKLDKLAHAGSNYDEVEELINNDELKNNEYALNFLKNVMLMNPERWNELLDETQERILSAADENPKSFIKQAETEDLDAAKEKFEAAIQKNAHNPETALGIIQQYANEVYREKNEYLDGNVHPNLKGLVLKERSNLLAGTAQPVSRADKILVRFMQTENRDVILENPDQRTELWRAIQNIKEHYQNEYEGRYDNLMKDDEAAKTSARPYDPTRYDRAARLQALIMLSHEAEGYITRAFEGNEKIQEELKYITFDEEPMKPDLDFNYEFPRAVTGTALATMGGFNFRSLSKRVFQGGMIATIAFNAFNAFKDWESVGIEESFQKLVRNPTLGAAIAALYATKRPEVVEGITGSKDSGAVEKIGYQRSLDNIVEDLAKDEKRAAREVKKIILSESEWKAMRDVRENMDARSLQNYLRDLAKENDKPMLTKANLEEITGKTLPLADAAATNRARFEIYNDLLTRENNLFKLKGDARQWASA